MNSWDSERDSVRMRGLCESAKFRLRCISKASVKCVINGMSSLQRQQQRKQNSRCYPRGRRGNGGMRRTYRGRGNGSNYLSVDVYVFRLRRKVLCFHFVYLKNQALDEVCPRNLSIRPDAFWKNTSLVEAKAKETKATFRNLPSLLSFEH